MSDSGLVTFNEITDETLFAFRPKDELFGLSFNEQLVIRIKVDGTFERGPGFTTMDEAARLFWQGIEEAMVNQLPGLVHRVNRAAAILTDKKPAS